MASPAELAPPVLELVRATTDGGIPVHEAAVVTITNKPRVSLDGVIPAWDKPWFGAIEFEVAGQAWYLEKFLNFGAEGQTYVVVEKSTGRRLAAKFCSSKTSREVELVQKIPRELAQHDNLCKYEMILKNISTHFHPAHHVIFMEHVPNGELFEFLASQEPSVRDKSVSEGTSRRFMRDIISGMAECYSHGVTHRDLKPENLLISEQGRIVIIDMGHAKKAEVSQGATGPGGLQKTTTANRYGTPAFMAPEVERGQEYDCEASDIWSVGVIAFMLHTKRHAFTQGGGIASRYDITGPDNEKFWTRIESNKFYAHAPFPDGLKKFINTLWQKDPMDRPTFSHLKAAIDSESENHNRVLELFRGLAWIAQPTNEDAEFAEEMLLTRPDMQLQINGETYAPPAQPRLW